MVKDRAKRGDERMEIKWLDKIGKKRVKFEKATNAKGKVYNKAITKDEPYRTVEVKNCLTPEEFTGKAVPEILAAKVPGFEDWPALFDHIAYGLTRHVAVMLNMGQDVKLTENQRETLKMYVKLVELGKNVVNGMTREQAITQLTMQGFENAETLFDAYYEPTEEDDDDEADEAGVAN